MQMKMISLNRGVIACMRCGDEYPVGRLEIIGPNVCSMGKCPSCDRLLLQNIPFAHGAYYPTCLDVENGDVIGSTEAVEWLSKPMIDAWNSPDISEVEFTVEKIKELTNSAVCFLPCLDYLYGHALLKLLQVDEHLRRNHQIIVLVPKYLRWLVPQGVSEVWVVDIPLKKGRLFFPAISERVRQEFSRISSEIYLSPARCHPEVGDPEQFTGIPAYPCLGKQREVTFVWRSDRLWLRSSIQSYLAEVHASLGGTFQKWHIIKYLSQLKAMLGDGWKFNLVAYGKIPTFPSWINIFEYPRDITPNDEKKFCEKYAQSALVVGAHGSNMLIPSWHAGAVIDLMPEERWGNFAQDILYRHRSPRIAASRIRYLPMSTCLRDLIAVSISLLTQLDSIERHYREDELQVPGERQLND